jgi:peptidyl-prolyl cis-trans isomerase C
MPFTQTLRTVVCRVAREPLMHFMLLGAVLWIAYSTLNTPARLSRITITKAQSLQLAEHYRQQYGVAPSSRQLEALIDNAVTQEMSFREALRLGLDRDDEIVRRRLIQKFEFLQQDLSTPPQPTDSVLKAFYDRHPQLYLLPARQTFTHVYFSPDRRGDLGARNAAAALSTALNRQGINRAPDRGDSYPGPSDFVSLTQEEIGRVFGREGLSQEIGALPLGQWSLPLRSGFGWHIVFLQGREPAHQAPFDEVRGRVESDFLEAERLKRNAESVNKMRGEFEITRE